MTSSLSFGNNLRAKRQELEIKQKELAQTVGISAQSLSVYEKGAKLPPLEIAIKLAQELGVSLDWLTGISTTESPGHEGIQTQGDAARAIAALVNTFYVKMGDVHVDNHGAAHTNVVFSGLLGEFVGALAKFNELQSSGALPPEMAAAAIDGLCKKLDSAPAEPF